MPAISYESRQIAEVVESLVPTEKLDQVLELIQDHGFKMDLKMWLDRHGFWTCSNAKGITLTVAMAFVALDVPTGVILEMPVGVYSFASGYNAEKYQEMVRKLITLRDDSDEV